VALRLISVGCPTAISVGWPYAISVGCGPYVLTVGRGPLDPATSPPRRRNRRFLLRRERALQLIDLPEAPLEEAALRLLRVNPRARVYDARASSSLPNSPAQVRAARVRVQVVGERSPRARIASMTSACQRRPHRDRRARFNSTTGADPRERGCRYSATIWAQSVAGATALRHVPRPIAACSVTTERRIVSARSTRVDPSAI